MATITPEPIMRIAMGFMAAKYLFTASDIGLFEALNTDPATLEELAKATGIPPRTLGIVAAAMVSLGLIEHVDGRYRNGEAVAAFLAGNPTSDLRPALRNFDQLGYPNWQNFAEAVRTDQWQPRFARFTEHQQQIFSAGVEAFSAAGAAALATSYDFSRHQKVLDIAGGTGSFLLAILRRYGNLQGTLFELPGACAVARQRLRKEPEGSRIRVVDGDVFKDTLPGGHDILIVANAIHVFSATHNVELMKKMRDQVQSGSRLLLVDLWTDPTHTQPPAAALMSGQFFLTSGEGQVYSEKEADEWLAETGWKKIERRPLAGPTSVIVAEAL